MDIPAAMLSALSDNRDQILGIAGVIGIDIGYAEPGGTPTNELAICVIVTDLNNVPTGIPDTIAGFPVSIIQRNIEPDVDLARYDSVPGGVSIARGTGVLSAAGTLGAIVRDTTTGELRGLTCFHVLCISPFAVGDDVQQPESSGAPVAANHLGGLMRWASTTASSLPVPGGGPSAPTSAGDAAICTIERTASATIADIGPVNGTAGAQIDDPVMKRGRTTGLTFGKVTHVHRTIFSAVLSAWLLEQFEVEVDSSRSSAWSAPGDSGSLVVREATKDAVGLHWGSGAGIGVAGDIDSIATDLGISLFWPIPQINALTPSEGSSAGGDEVTIDGLGFQLASEVSFGANAATFSRQVTSDRQIIATTPQGSGIVDVTVAAPGGTSLPTSFTYQ